MSGYWSRLFVAFALVVFVVPLFAADKNFTDYDEHKYYDACERLLDANLSGYFVATDITHNRSQFVSLRRLGSTSAYVVATAKMDMRAQGIRELEFSRQTEGWRLGDPYSPEKRVNVLSIERANETVHFKMADVADVAEMEYRAVPHEDLGQIVGDILSPDGWVLNLQSPFEAQYRFTRVKLDRTFEQVVSQSLKSLLADRSEHNQMGFGDYVIVVETKMPLNIEEATRLLGTQLVYPIEDRPGHNFPTYRFAVPKNLYTFLEAIGDWTRLWQVAHVDAIPGNMLHPQLLQRIVRAISSTERETGVPPVQGSGPSNLRALEAVISQETPTHEPTTSAALEALRSIGGGDFTGNDITAHDPRYLRGDQQQHPRDLDAEPDQDHDHENGHNGNGQRGK